MGFDVGLYDSFATFVLVILSHVYSCHGPVSL